QVLLDRDLTVGDVLARLVGDAEAAGPEHCTNCVAVQPRARLQRGQMVVLAQAWTSTRDADSLRQPGGSSLRAQRWWTGVLRPISGSSARRKGSSRSDPRTTAISNESSPKRLRRRVLRRSDIWKPSGNADDLKQARRAGAVAFYTARNATTAFNPPNASEF